MMKSCLLLSLALLLEPAFSALGPPAGFSVEPQTSAALYDRECFLLSSVAIISLGALCMLLVFVVLILAVCNCRLRRKLTNMHIEMQKYEIYDDISPHTSSQMTTPASNKTSYFSYFKRGDSLPPYTAHQDEPINTTSPYYSNEVPNQIGSLQREEPIYLNLQHQYVPTTDDRVYSNLHFNVSQQNKIRESECDCISLDSFD